MIYESDLDAMRRIGYGSWPMILQLYSVKDTKVGAFMPPFVARARGEALRNFQSAVGDKDHQFAKFPADYELWFLGKYDDGTGLVESSPERVIGGNEF